LETAFGSAPQGLSPQSTPELAEALREALETGENQAWEKPPYHGGLTVTQLTNEARGRCRFVTYSVGGEGEDWRSRSVRFCHQTNGDWRHSP
jgi:surface antigen